LSAAVVDLAKVARRTVASEAFEGLDQKSKPNSHRSFKRRVLMKYLLLIYHEEAAWNAIKEPEREEIYREFRKLRERLISQGQYVDGSQLQPTTTASSVRIRNGKDLITDGPFAETREQLGGYFLVNVNSPEEAVAIAKQIPSARMGTIEVRALVERAAEANA